MIAWDKVKAPLRAQRVSLIYDKRKDDESAEEWTGWRVGNLRHVFEPILWFTKPYKIGGTIADNIKKYGVGAYNEQILKKYGLDCNNMIKVKATYSDTGLHPTQKPLELMKILIELTTVENQVVLDPFAGSGTTLLAEKLLNRQYIGFENNLEYYEKTKERIHTANAYSCVL